MKKGAKKWRYILFSFAGLMVILYLIAQFWVSYKLDPLIDRLVRNGIIRSSDSLYSIRYKEITYNLTSKTLVLKDVNLRANTELFVKRKSDGNQVPVGLLNIHFDELRLTGIEFYKALVTRDLEAANIVIDNPQIQYTLYDTIARRDTLDKRPVNFDLYKLFSEKFHSLTIKNIIINNASFSLYKNSTDTIATVGSTGIQIQVNKLRIDSAYSANRLELNLANKIRIKIAEAHWLLPGNIYRVQFTNMNLDATNESLRFDRIRLVPLADKYKMGELTGYAQDLIRLTFDSVSFQRLDMNLILYNHSISCGYVQVGNFNLKDFRYKAAPDKPGDKGFPTEQLRAAPLLLHVDSVIVKNGQVEYSEQIPSNALPGAIFFSEISGIILNISNDSASLVKNHYCTLAARGLLMGKGKLKLGLSLNETSPVDSFTFNGWLGRMELNPFNQLILQSANVKLKEGTLDALTFNIKGSKKSAAGDMTLLYHDVSVLMLKDEMDKNGKKEKVGKRNFKSILANAIALVSANPLKGKTRHVTLYQERDPENYVFNYLWRTILSGIKETMLSMYIKKGEEKLKELGPKIKKTFNK